MKHQKGAVYALEAFKDTTCPELKEELEITIADMRSGNEKVALTRLESRVGSTMMSDITRGLIGVVRGDDMVDLGDEVCGLYPQFQWHGIRCKTCRARLCVKG